MTTHKISGIDSRHHQKKEEIYTSTLALLTVENSSKKAHINNTKFK
jgi:hypothetical protein